MATINDYIYTVAQEPDIIYFSRDNNYNYLTVTSAEMFASNTTVKLFYDPLCLHIGP